MFFILNYVVYFVFIYKTPSQGAEYSDLIISLFGTTLPSGALAVPAATIKLDPTVAQHIFVLPPDLLGAAKL